MLETLALRCRSPLVKVLYLSSFSKFIRASTVSSIKCAMMAGILAWVAVRIEVVLALSDVSTSTLP
jgi:hypothetical protein